MNSDDDNNEPVLAHWLDGSLPEAEKKRFIGSDEPLLQRIASTASAWQLPPLRREYVAPVAGRSVVHWWWWGAAASVVLAVSAWWFAPHTVAGTAGQSTNIVLSDSTEVLLFGESELTWSKAFPREVKLSGMALFDVQVHGPFQVQFEGGQVDVLGTRFLVSENGVQAAIECFEGRVKVSSGSQNQIIEALQSAEISSDREIIVGSSTEIEEGELNYKQAPLRRVFNELERYFGVRVNAEGVDLERRFSGAVALNSLDQALIAVCVPMNLSHRAQGSTIFVRNAEN